MNLIAQVIPVHDIKVGDRLVKKVSNTGRITLTEDVRTIERPRFDRANRTHTLINGKRYEVIASELIAVPAPDTETIPDPDPITSDQMRLAGMIMNAMAAVR